MKDNYNEIKIKHTNKIKFSEQSPINNCNDMYKFLLAMYDPDTIEFTEQCIVALFNRRMKYMGHFNAGIGTNSYCVVDVKKIYAIALKTGACGLVISHNHPSGESKPSKHDEIITNKLKSGLKTLEIEFIDHIIITKYEYYSFREKETYRIGA